MVGRVHKGACQQCLVGRGAEIPSVCVADVCCHHVHVELWCWSCLLQLVLQGCGVVVCVEDPMVMTIS